jgi:hypothetical protein
VTAGQCEAGARAANLHMPERPMAIAKLEQRLEHSGMATCGHMQQTGWCRQLTEVSLSHGCEQAALGVARLETLNEQLHACLEAVRHRLRPAPHSAQRAGRRRAVQKPRLSVPHGEKTLDKGASSGPPEMVY